MNALLTVRALTKTFDTGGQAVVRGIDFDVFQGEIFALLGPSGCGKTTTLRLIAGFEQADEGSVQLNDKMLSGPGKHVPPHQRKLGFVFQDYALFPHLSVFDNVCFGLRNMDLAAARKRAGEVLEMVGLCHLMVRMPDQLSGGQQQRVALARSIAPEPQLLLLDEPFNHLDAGRRQNMRREVRAMLKEAGITTILVTHDQEEALTFADRLGIMRNGVMDQVGTPVEVYNAPRTAYSARFLGATNLVEAEAFGDHAMTSIGRIAIEPHAEGKVLLSIRPESLVLRAAAGRHSESENSSTDNSAGSSSSTVEGLAGFHRQTFEITTREFKGHDTTYRLKISAEDVNQNFGSNTEDNKPNVENQPTENQQRVSGEPNNSASQNYNASIKLTEGESSSLKQHDKEQPNNQGAVQENSYQNAPQTQKAMQNPTQPSYQFTKKIHQQEWLVQTNQLSDHSVGEHVLIDAIECARVVEAGASV